MTFGSPGFGAKTTFYNRPTFRGQASGPGGKALAPSADEEYEVLRRMKKQQGIKELLMKLGSIISEKKLQREEAAKAEVEAVKLQTPLVLDSKQQILNRLPLRE